MPSSIRLLPLAIMLSASTAFAAEPVKTEMVAFRPERRDATSERIESLKLPDGFRVNVFARDLGHARMMATAPDGAIYLTCPREGKVMRLRDSSGDGVADDITTAASGLDNVHGIVIDGKTIYLAAPTKVWQGTIAADGSIPDPALIIDDLPDGAQHPNRTLAIHDGKLWISVGSSCNACDETNPEHATLLRADLDGSNREVFAKGLRNTIGYGWHPQTGVLWGMDHGSDGRGDDVPPEELNRLEEGKHYGWPWAFGKRQPDPIMDDPPGTKKEAFAGTTEPAVLEYQAHAAPIAMVFYTADAFPAHYRNGAFIAMRGSWNRHPAVGYKVVYLDFDESGDPVGFEDFLTGFLIEDGEAHFARLAGLTLTADGALLASDDTNGVIYRISAD